MAQQIPVAVAAEEGYVTYSGVTLGAPGSQDTLVNLAVVKVEELTGGTVLDEPGQAEMLVDAAGKVYEVEIAALKPPQGPTRKYVLIGRLVRDGTAPPSEPPAEETSEETPEHH
jgi:hypothetical protein